MIFLYFDVTVHDVLVMEIGESLTNISEIFFDFIFGEGLHCEFIVEGSSFCILKHHVGDLSFRIDVDI